MLNSNKIKIIAIICMIIDHIGYFFYTSIDFNIYYILRSIGRIAMPLFVFMLVEGFNYTKNFKKYIFRLILIAIITQVIIYSLNIVNMNIFKCRFVSNLTDLNIVFSFVLILLLLRLLDRKVLEDKLCDIASRIFLFIIIILIYLCIPIDYNIFSAILAIIMYYIRKIEVKNKLIEVLLYIIQILVIGIISLLAINDIKGIFAIFSIIFISMYNGKLGKKSKFISSIFYFIFPLQYFIIYAASLLLQ